MKLLNHTGRLVLLLSSATVLFTACGDKVLDFRNAEIVNGKVYADGANTPFSGKVTNVPAGTTFGAQKGYAKLLAVLTKTSPDLSVASVGLTALCDTGSDDGVLDGKTICKKPSSDAVIIETTFSSGLLDGSFTVHDETGADTLVELSFKNGQPDGKMQVYSARTGKLTHTAIWQDGGLNGEEEGFDPDTGNRILHGTLVNGQYDGEFAQYLPDGKTLIGKGMFTNGVKNGEVDHFDPKTGIRAVDHYVNGKLDGVSQAWDASGKLIAEKTYTNGEDAVEKQKRAELDELIKEMDTSNPDPKVAACVKSYPKWSYIANGDTDERINRAKEVLAWRDDCRANPDAHPIADNSLKIMPTTNTENKQ